MGTSIGAHADRRIGMSTSGNSAVKDRQELVGINRAQGPIGELTRDHRAFLDRLHRELQFGTPLNPTHFFWDTLITDFNCPFIKRELIRENPVGIIYPWRWPEVVSACGGYDAGPIRRHLQST